MRDAENPLACFLRRGGSDSPALLMKRKTAHAQKLAPRKHPEGFRKRNRKPTSSDTIPCTPFAFRKDPEGFRKKNRKGNKPRTKLASRKLPEAQPEELPEGNRHKEAKLMVCVFEIFGVWLGGGGWRKMVREPPEPKVVDLQKAQRSKINGF